MGVGIFGKLPDKRDFVQHEMPPPLMEILDRWLQGAVAQAKNDLGKGWLDSYLSAPIWRFWMGRRVAGHNVIGALMPSVDGVGRYFPLCCAGIYAGEIAPPDLDTHDEWFEAVEEAMLATLSDEGSYDTLKADLARVDPPENPMVLSQDTTLRAVFGRLRHQNMDMLYSDLSYWWVPPDAGTSGPRALVRRGLPAPHEYATMLAGEYNPDAVAMAGEG